jgi:hypothetical protein
VDSRVPLRRFIHIPKTGGVTVMDFCQRHDLPVLYGRRKRGSQHITAKHSTYHHWQHEDSEKFAIIRNPLTRLVSWFRYLSELGAYSCSFDRFLADRIEPEPRGFKTPSPWLSQSHWVSDAPDITDLRLFAFESMDQTIPAYLGIDQGMLSLNVTNHAHEDLTAWYDHNQRDKILRLFESDFVLWHSLSRK